MRHDKFIGGRFKFIFSQDKMKFIPKALLLMMVGSSSSSLKSPSGRQQVAAYANRSKFPNRGIYIGDVCAIITSSEEGIDAKVAGLCDGQKSFAMEIQVPKKAKYDYNEMPEEGLISVNCGGDFTYVAISGSKADPLRNYAIKGKNGKRKLSKTALYSVCRFLSIRLPTLPIEIELISDQDDMPRISMSDLRVDQVGDIVADLTLENIAGRTQCSLKLALLDKDMEKLRGLYFSSNKKATFFNIIQYFFGANKVCLHLTSKGPMSGELVLAARDAQAQILANHSGTENTITCSSRSENSIFAQFFTLSNPFPSFCETQDGVDVIKDCHNRKAIDFCEIALSIRKKLVDRLSLGF